MKNKILSSVLSMTILFACSNDTNDKELDKKQIMIAQIDSLHKQMFNHQSMEVDKNLASKEITAYQDFVNKYPDDSLSAEYLFRASDLSKAVGDNLKAIESLKQICENYPAYKKIPECLFLQGYYYQEFFDDTILAKEFYNRLISKYPTHAFVDDAQALMNMFGKSEQDIIKEFEKKEQGR